MTLRFMSAAASTPALSATAPETVERNGGAMATAEQEHSAHPMVLRGLHKRWRKDLPLVLDGLDLTLETGSKTWIGGRNGVGKTTMLRIAAGLIEPESGRAEVWGLSARENRTRYQQLVSFLPAGDRGLYARLSVRRQLEFCAHLALVPRARLAAVVERAIVDFELHDLADRRVDRLSMGQRQRLRIAMTFLPDPEIVLLDEPLTSLDGEGAILLDRALAELTAQGGAVLWCSPSGEQLDAEFDARFSLQDGRLVQA